MVTKLNNENKMRKLDKSNFDSKFGTPSWFEGIQMADSIPFTGSRNLQQEFDLKAQMQQEFSRNWDRDFGGGFLIGNQDSRASPKMGASVPPMFSYSQKNFHIDDGNLYSIFSPFQARKSAAKPSFLRGHMMSDEANMLLKNSLSMDNAPLNVEGTRKSRSKLKFHQQDVPPQYRSDTKDSSSFTSRKLSSSSHHQSSSSSYSKSLFSESKRESFFENEEDFNSESLFHKRERRSMDPFEVLDLSNPQENIFNDDWERASESGHRLRRSHVRRSFFEDSDDDDEPLNLCIADQLKQKDFPQTLAGERIKKMQRNFFANRSPATSIFRSPSIEFTHNVDESDGVKIHRQTRKTHEDEAMDLSYRKEENSKRKTTRESIHTHSKEMRDKSCKLRKVPYISEMLENMTIWDDQSRSPKPPQPQEGKETQETTVKNCEPVFPIWEPKTEVTEAEKTLPPIKPQKSKSAPVITAESLQQPQFVAATVPANYYVFVPNPYMQISLDPTIANPQTSQDLSDKTKDAITLEVTAPKPSTSVRSKVKGKNGQQKQFGDAMPQIRPSHSDNNVNICKFKLIKGVQPMLEEKKNFFVPLPRSVKRPSEDNDHALPSKAATVSKGNHFRTYKIHVGLQEEMGRKLAAGRKIRRRSRKALARDKLEATFREQGFLIKTQQVSSAEGSVYCKFRQLKKFTRYLFKSWRNYLPKDLEEIGSGHGPVNPNLTLSLPDIPGTYEQLYSVPTARSASATFGPENYGLSDVPGGEKATNLTIGSSNLAVVSDTSSMSDSFVANVSPCPSTSSLTHASSTSSVP